MGSLVSILVLMEDVKEPLKKISIVIHLFIVSILVLMEDVKELLQNSPNRSRQDRFQSLF